MKTNRKFIRSGLVLNSELNRWRIDKHENEKKKTSKVVDNITIINIKSNQYSRAIKHKYILQILNITYNTYQKYKVVLKLFSLLNIVSFLCTKVLHHAYLSMQHFL